jgi:hypothetical protein
MVMYLLVNGRKQILQELAMHVLPVYPADY